MQKQQGRSMIEMIGVLGIIGIISIGGMSVVSNALQNHRNNMIMTDAATLADISTKTACQSEGYESFTDLIYKSDKIPSNLSYNSTDKKFVGVDDVTYDITKIGNKDEVAEAFVVNIGSLSDQQCLIMTMANWGSRKTSGFLGFSVTKDITYSNNEVKNSETFSDAVSECNKGVSNTVKLLFIGCQ